MLFSFLTSTTAFKYIALTGEDKTQIGSEQGFETIKHHILYNHIIMFTNNYEKSETFLKVASKIGAYVVGQMRLKNLKRKTLVANSDDNTYTNEINLLLATHIIYKFKIGQFNCEMLELVNDFSKDEQAHWEVIGRCTGSVLQHLVKTIKPELNGTGYNRHRSLCYLSFKFANLMYRIVLLQLREKRWCQHEYFHFIKQITNYHAVNPYYLSFTLSDTENDWISTSVSLKDILKQGVDIEVIEKYIDGADKDFEFVSIVFTLNDIKDGIVESKDKKTQPFLFEFKSKVIDELRELIRAKYPTIIIFLDYREMSDYELYFIENDKASTGQGLQLWRKNCDNLTMKSRAVCKYIEEFYRIIKNQP